MDHFQEGEKLTIIMQSPITTANKTNRQKTDEHQEWPMVVTSDTNCYR